MANVHGKATVFQIDDSGGTLRDISAYVDSVSMPRSADTAETTAFGDDDKTFIAGLRSGTISASGPWDSTLDGYIAPTLGQSATLSFSYEPGNGNVTYTGECILTSYDPPADVGDAVRWSATWQITGAVGRA